MGVKFKSFALFSVCLFCLLIQVDNSCRFFSMNVPPCFPSFFSVGNGNTQINWKRLDLTVWCVTFILQLICCLMKRFLLHAYCLVAFFSYLCKHDFYKIKDHEKVHPRL